MANLSLRDTINEVMGLDRCIFMTQYFNAGDADIFLVVNNDVDGTYHLFYEESNGKILVYKIGSARTFKRFICSAYRINPILNYSNDYWGGLLRAQHIEAKQRAGATIQNWLVADAEALAELAGAENEKIEPKNT